MAEETCKGLVARKIKEVDGYASNQDVELNGVIWFKEDSYKDNAEYEWIADILSTASKNQKGKDRGTPDFVIVKKDSDVIVLVECKNDVKKHSNKKDIKDYISIGYGDAKATVNCAIDGVLWYAEFFKDKYDVIAIAVSGTSEINSKITTYVWPKNGEKSDIHLISDGSLANTKMQFIDA